jgi:AcrR family transcriptional regulator
MINTVVKQFGSLIAVSPRASKREALIDGALRCLEEQGYASVRTRDIAAAANANLASIGYHFGSKDELLGQALREGFRRWLGEVAAAVPQVGSAPPHQWLQQLATSLRSSVERHRNFVLAFLEAVARAPRDEALRESLAESYRETRDAVGILLNLGDDEIGRSLASTLIATFDGLLIQWLIDPQATPGDKDLLTGMDRLAGLFAAGKSP